MRRFWVPTFLLSVLSATFAVLATYAAEPIKLGLAAVVFALLAIAWKPLPEV